MENKLTFEEALETAFAIKNTITAAFHEHDYGISHHEMISLFMLTRKWNGKAKVSDIKMHMENHHRNHRADHKHFKKVEVMLSKTFTALESLDLIQRIKCEDDRRESIIEVTVKGKSMVTEFLANAEKRWNARK